MVRFVAFLFSILLFIPAHSDSPSKQIDFELRNTCHYDEVLTMDVWTSYAPEFAIKSFKTYIRAKYSKNVDFHVRRVLTPDEFFDRVRAGITDVISPSHNFLKDERTQFIKHKLIIPLDPNLIPNLKSVNPMYINNNFVTEGGKLYAVPLAAGGYSLLYKRDHFKSPPTSWNILWDPQYKKRYALSKDFYEANMYITALALGVRPDQISDIKLIDTPAFKNKLRELLAGANFWQGAPKDEDLTTSVLTAAWGVSHSVSKDAQKKWLLAYPKEGVTFWTDYLSVTKNIERSPFAKTLAMEWLNYVLGPEFQEKAIIENRRYMSPLSIQALRPSALIRKEEVKFLTEHSVYWPVLSIRNRNGLKLIYDQVMAEVEAQAER